MTTRITGTNCPHCWRDNRGYANVCTSEFCEPAAANRNRSALIDLGEIAYQIHLLEARVIEIAARTAELGASTNQATLTSTH
jgi:hypothetical protein